MKSNRQLCLSGADCASGNCSNFVCQSAYSLEPDSSGNCKTTYNTLEFAPCIGRCVYKGYKDYTFFQGEHCLTSLNCHSSDYCSNSKCTARASEGERCHVDIACKDGFECFNEACRRLCFNSNDCYIYEQTVCSIQDIDSPFFVAPLVGICMSQYEHDNLESQMIDKFNEPRLAQFNYKKFYLNEQSYPSLLEDAAVDPLRFLFSQRGLLYFFLPILALIAVVGAVVGLWMRKRRNRAAQGPDAGTSNATGARSGASRTRDGQQPTIDEPWMMPPKDADLPDYSPSDSSPAMLTQVVTN